MFKFKFKDLNSLTQLFIDSLEPRSTCKWCVFSWLLFFSKSAEIVRE